MLIRKPILEMIKAGNVSLAFRRWQRAAVKNGSKLKTAVGVLRVHHIEKIQLNAITQSDAHNAGYSNVNTLLAELRSREGQVYRIELSYEGEDPRIALRQVDQLTVDELNDIVGRLQRMDSRSKTGAWTEAVLSAIDAFPMTPAATIASYTGFEKDCLKINIRKLKNLGLTISHQPGYELSPRGFTVLNHLKKIAYPSGDREPPMTPDLNS